MVRDAPARSSAVTIRSLTPADLRAVLAIEESSFSTPWRSTTFSNLLSRADADLFAATEDGRLVGYAVCWTVLDQAELGNVAVDPSMRGRGIARKLIHAVLQRVAERGADECFLEVRVSNRAARHLYEDIGFVAIGRRRGYYERPREDALVMRIGLERA